MNEPCVFLLWFWLERIPAGESRDKEAKADASSPAMCTCYICKGVGMNKAKKKKKRPTLHCMLTLSTLAVRHNSEITGLTKSLRSNTIVTIPLLQITKLRLTERTAPKSHCH